MAITQKQRVYAGLWFMAAGIIPALYVSFLFHSLLTRVDAFEFILWVIVLPLLTTGVSGALFGASILDPSIVRRGKQAAYRGLRVAYITFLSSTVIITAWEASFNEHVKKAFGPALIGMLVYGFIFAGWLVAIVGMLAGWLLYRSRISKRGGMGLP